MGICIFSQSLNKNVFTDDIEVQKGGVTSIAWGRGPRHSNFGKLTPKPVFLPLHSSVVNYEAPAHGNTEPYSKTCVFVSGTHAYWEKLRVV